MVKFSILIPTVVSRKQKFERLHYQLSKQRMSLPVPEVVEIIHLSDNKEMSIGAKRNKLLSMANGEYVSMVDDDDMVAPTYISDILKAIESGGGSPDCIGFQIRVNIAGQTPCMADMSNKYSSWSETNGRFRYLRTPYQKTPIKKEIAIKIGYPDMRFAEDTDYSKRLKESNLIKTEAYIDKALYYYTWVSEGNHNDRYGITDEKRKNLATSTGEVPVRSWKTRRNEFNR